MRNALQSGDKYTLDDVDIVSKETVFKGFFEMVQFRFKHKRFEGGWSSVIDREMFVRGEAAAMLPYDPVRDQVVLIEQIRVGALEHESPWQMEIVAGIVDKQESIEELVCREAVEEAGVDVKNLVPITRYYLPRVGAMREYRFSSARLMRLRRLVFMV
ncbi:ADP-ribose pyrophosphatase [Vibrio maritimus]|uniref:ADP-ribose pyrophosphatase n=1 Tax=Vibrio maritimus TaxID=990268 RepID=A0A090S195_9VIBR|nr:ADP-ribose pyrophosphatase [Vibrio maritimus]